jgi:hypothetical protein
MEIEQIIEAFKTVNIDQACCRVVETEIGRSYIENKSKLVYESKSVMSQKKFTIS